MKLKFSKYMRLHSEKEINHVFKQGEKFYIYPFRIFYLPVKNQNHHRFLISVPKRNFKKAVDRNLLKRRVRECYRLHKNNLVNTPPFHLAFLYTEKKIITTADIEKSMKKIVNKLADLP